MFEIAKNKLSSIEPQRILLVGDTLETDILGGVMMGFATCLTLSGVYAGRSESVDELCADSGIYPDFVVESISS